MCLDMFLVLILTFKGFSQSGFKQEYLFLDSKKIEAGAENLVYYLYDLERKNVGVVANHSSVIGNTHLVDTLLSLSVNIAKVFSPEHGFRGHADAGEHLESSVDNITGLPLISLYGNNRKPTPEQMKGIDIMIFDIQDVGVRFYTYISTLHYVMEACAERNIPLIVLDRPNPNGNYVDGPVLQKEYTSFIGMHPVPIVYGMTIGEYAQMINGEKWLKDSLTCDLSVVPLKNYMHDSEYSLPVAPSPNLRTDLAIRLYPSLCLLEATTVSIGRGTEHPFECFGHPDFPDNQFCFTPESGFGAKNPKQDKTKCFGFNLMAEKNKRPDQLNLEYLIIARELLDSNTFIDQSGFFNRLAGNGELAVQLMNRVSEDEIRASWEPALSDFKKIREKYLLYP